MMKTKKFYFLNIIIPGLFAFLIWGGWAFYSNFGTGSEKSAFYVQGITSLFLTSYLALSINFFFNILINNKLYRKIVPTLVTSTKTFTLVYFAHSHYNTENIFTTMIPPFLLGIAYNIYYTYQLEKNSSLKLFNN